MSEEKCDWILAPHMIETSYLYLKSSELMWPYSISISIVNSALALEILLKSFNCRVINYDQYEKYQFNSKVLNKGENAHDLMHLYDALPDPIKHKLSNDFDLDLIKKYRHTFTNSRYIYEKNAITGGSTALMEMTALLLRRTVGFYLERGCSDIWIKNYPNV